MAAAGRGREQDSARFVYVTRFGSHQCGGVLQLGGRGAQGLWGQGPGAACRQEKPREAMAVADVQSSSELPLGSQLRVPTTPGVEAAASASSQLRASRVQSCTRQSARAGLIQKDAAKKYDFPIPLNEASKIMKKKKKAQITQDESSYLLNHGGMKTPTEMNVLNICSKSFNFCLIISGEYVFNLLC
ncbi:uncharacterized protein C5orf47 homolog isoform X4 [Pan troglodytes]|uniref:uncharacterized protein C5orf47 homolog isoform X4 n=1 Tax=Pan troglodytes TaxID=9598 RepID=UPI0030136029